eukprot:2372871-Amphidinium_carterae.2
MQDNTQAHTAAQAPFAWVEWKSSSEMRRWCHRATLLDLKAPPARARCLVPARSVPPRYTCFVTRSTTPARLTE